MEKFKELVPSNVRDYAAAAVITIGGCTVVLKVSGAVIKWVSAKRRQRRWRNTPKDVVILHRIPAAIAAPNASPFVLKLVELRFGSKSAWGSLFGTEQNPETLIQPTDSFLQETYLRMANIPYEIDLSDGMGPKGKTPWITLNGEHISDSQICIEFLAKKFDKRVGKYSEHQRAVGTMARIMMDEHFYWGLLMWRYVFSSAKGYGPENIFAMPKLLVKLFMALYGRRMIFVYSWFQGIGRHSEEEITKIISDDLRALSAILGNKKFILGEEPTEDDCAIFGELAQALWCMPGSPYEKLLNEELHNLKQYCLRLKDLYWPDWDDCLAKKS